MSDGDWKDSVEGILDKLARPAPERHDNEWREKMDRLKAAQETNSQEIRRLEETFAGVPRKIKVNKRTHRVRFENETEDGVTIVVEKREG